MKEEKENIELSLIVINKDEYETLNLEKIILNSAGDLLRFKKRGKVVNGYD